MFLVNEGRPLGALRVEDVFSAYEFQATEQRIRTDVRMGAGGLNDVSVSDAAAGAGSVLRFKGAFFRTVANRYIESSSDGLTWTRLIDLYVDLGLATVPNNTQIAGSADYLMIVCRLTAGVICLRSTDGVTWTSVDPPVVAADTPYGLVFAAGSWFALIYNATTKYTIYCIPETGTSWSSVMTVDNTPGQFRSFLASNGCVFFCVQATKKVIDATTLAISDATGPTYINDLLWDAANSRHLAVSNTTTLYTSSDGVTFTALSTLPEVCYAIIKLGAWFIAFGARRIYYSTDALSWTAGAGYNSGSSATDAGLGDSIATDGSIAVIVGSKTIYSRPIVINPALARPQGMIWTKDYNDGDSATEPLIYDTLRGPFAALNPRTTAAQADAGSVLGFLDDGFAAQYASGEGGVAWSFREADRFFTPRTIVHTNGTPSTVDLAMLGAVGMVIVKRIDGTGDWEVWHRSLAADRKLLLSGNAAETNASIRLSVSGTTLTIASGTASGTYVVYAWAHDVADDGLVQCDTYAVPGADVTVNLGWQPQFVLIKARNTTGYWVAADTERDLCMTGGNSVGVALNGSEAGLDDSISLTPTGFKVRKNAGNIGSDGYYYVYMAIRAPAPAPIPDVGAPQDFFGYQTTAGDGTARNIPFNVTVKSDLVISKNRTGSTQSWFLHHRLLGTCFFGILASNKESSSYIRSYNRGSIEISASGPNALYRDYIHYSLTRMRGAMDIVAYDGAATAKTVPHELSVPPELMIVKCRSANSGWAVYSGDATRHLLLESNAAPVAASAYWADTAPTSIEFTVGTGINVNSVGNSYVAMLFASLAGISKIGTYNGNQAQQSIDCGFTAGARFVLIKKIDGGTGDWFVWDAARGIVSGGDPYLKLNTDGIEQPVDYIDPLVGGFEVASGSNPMNTSGSTYLYLAIA